MHQANGGNLKKSWKKRGFAKVLAITDYYRTEHPMILRYLTIRMMLILTLFICIYPAHAETADDAAMVSATKNWLSLIDQADYQTAWQQAATLIQQAISLEKWQATMRETRLPLGQLKHRQLKQISPLQNLPNLPPGEYYLVIYETELSKPVTVQETLITQKTRENSWPVFTYRIKLPEKSPSE